MNIKVRVVNQELKVATNLSSRLAKGSQQFVRFFFKLDEEWDNLTVFAQFVQGGNAYNQYLDAENSVYLPSEIKVGKCLLILCGTGQGVRATTNFLVLTINENHLVNNASSTVITESLYEQLVDMVKASMSAPVSVTTAAEMTDHSKIYLYNGSESGYSSGHWYYWDGTNWVDGGVYSGNALPDYTSSDAGKVLSINSSGSDLEWKNLIDTTLSQSGKAADASVTGDEVNLNRQIISNLLTASVQIVEINESDLLDENDEPFTDDSKLYVWRGETGTYTNGHVYYYNGSAWTDIGVYSREGSNVTQSGKQSHAEGIRTTASGSNAHAEGAGTTASGSNTHAEGYYTTSSGQNAHAEGRRTLASGNYSHAEGDFALYNSNRVLTEASGNASHAEGAGNKATGENSHAEGLLTNASGDDSHAEGFVTLASGNFSHAEGSSTIAEGHHSHAEGANAYAKGEASHAEGLSTYAEGDYSSAGGESTTAKRKSQTVIGRFNANDTQGANSSAYGKYAFIIGNGTDEQHLSNALAVDWEGNIEAKTITELKNRRDELRLYSSDGFQYEDGLYLDANGTTLFARTYTTLSVNTHNSYNDAISAAQDLYAALLDCSVITIDKQGRTNNDDTYMYSIQKICGVTYTYSETESSVLLYYTTTDDSSLEKTILVAYNAVAEVGTAQVDFSIIG